MILTSKNKLADQILRLLDGRTTRDSDILIEEIYVAIEQTLADVVRYRYFEDKQDDIGYIDGNLIIPYKNQEVLKDEDISEYYVCLPSNYAAMPGGMGVSFVSGMGDQTNAYVPVSSNFKSLFRNLKSACMGGRNTFRVEDGRIYLPSFDDKSNPAPSKIMVKLVAGIGGKTPYEEFSIPSDMQKVVVDSVFQIYVNKQPSDYVNDGVDIK
jgi:hypothetical protein